MDQIDKYKRVKKDQQQVKGKAKVIPQDMRDFRSNKYNNNRPQRDFTGQSGSTTTQVVNMVFREPVHQVLKKIKNKPFFKWPNKKGGDNTTRIKGTPQKIVELCGVTWSSWTEKGS